MQPLPDSDEANDDDRHCDRDGDEPAAGRTYMDAAKSATKVVRPFRPG